MVGGITVLLALRNLHILKETIGSLPVYSLFHWIKRPREWNQKYLYTFCGARRSPYNRVGVAQNLEQITCEKCLWELKTYIEGRHRRIQSQYDRCAYE